MVLVSSGAHPTDRQDQVTHVSLIIQGLGTKIGAQLASVVCKPFLRDIGSQHTHTHRCYFLCRQWINASFKDNISYTEVPLLKVER